MRGLFVVIIGLCGSCAQMPRMPWCASNEWGKVHAESQMDANRVLDELDLLGPQVLAAVPGLVVRPVDIYLVNEIRSEFWAQRVPDGQINGACFRENGVRWIEVRSMLSVESERHMIAHELLHHWLGPEWEEMPFFVLEGWADYAADVAGHREPAGERVDQVILLASTLFHGLVVDNAGDAVRCALGDERIGASEIILANGGLGVPMPPRSWRMRAVLSTCRAEDVHGTNAQYFESWVGLGYLIAARIGIEKMHQVCLSAHSSGQKVISPDCLLQAAGLTEEVAENWNRAIIDLLEPSEHAEIRRRVQAYRQDRGSRQLSSFGRTSAGF